MLSFHLIHFFVWLLSHFNITDSNLGHVLTNQEWQCFSNYPKMVSFCARHFTSKVSLLSMFYSAISSKQSSWGACSDQFPKFFRICFELVFAGFLIFLPMKFKHDVGKKPPSKSWFKEQHCKWKKMDDIKAMFVFKHIDQKPFCNDKIH